MLKEATGLSVEGRVRPRPSVSGGVVLEVPGGAVKADRLADRLATHFGDKVKTPKAR